MNECEHDLMVFVDNYEVLYGVQSMIFNVNALLHVVSSVRHSGPLWATFAFLFENDIHFLKQPINGPKTVEQWMAKKLLKMLL